MGAPPGRRPPIARMEEGLRWPHPARPPARLVVPLPRPTRWCTCRSPCPYPIPGTLPVYPTDAVTRYPARLGLPCPLGGYPVRRTYAAATRPGCRLRGERSRCPSGHYPGPDFDLERQSRPRRSWHRWVRPPDSGGACSALRYDAGAGYFYATLPNRLLPCRCPAGAPQIYQPSCHYPAWIVASLPAPCRTRLDPALPFLTLPYAWLPCHVIPLTCKRTRRALGQR